MKKSLLIAAVAGLAFASCKKDYTCKCIDTSDNSTISTTTIHATKGDAKTTCTNLSVPLLDVQCSIQ